jgi:hypothetical protein
MGDGSNDANESDDLCDLGVFNGVTTSVRAETPEEWITLGARVHGGFGAFIPVGIRIGLDALQRLNSKPRAVTVVYYDSDKAPCACVAYVWRLRRSRASDNARYKSRPRKPLLVPWPSSSSVTSRPVVR